MRARHLSFLLLVSFASFPSVALAYVGPGAGLSAIGTVIAVLGAILLAIVGFLWYPIKRLFKQRLKGKEREARKDTGEDKI